jgi:hypothetical protein
MLSRNLYPPRAGSWHDENVRAHDDSSGKRSTRIFERMGWKEIDRKEQTKFKDYMTDPVYTITIYRELNESTGRKKTEE